MAYLDPSLCIRCQVRPHTKIYILRNPGFLDVEYKVCNVCYNKLHQGDLRAQRFNEQADEIVDPDAWAEEEPNE